MSNTNIIFNEFIKYVHQHFEAEISLEKVEDILRLEEDYNKDNPTSHGKSLLLKRLIFSGKKVSGEKFQYDQKLYNGINVWIADNHKGKSTIFKIIKFALTGTDSIKPDIKPWIDEILLEFQIGKETYTIYIDRTSRDKGAMFSFGIDEFLQLRKNQKIDTIEKAKEFEFKSKSQFEEKVQEFFFEHFSFYTLMYTQKNSSKDDFELNTANLSWTSYFKSIYLESSNYEYLFFEKENMGSQGRKIFEMILGLPLTYPINMLGVQRDKVFEEIGKLNLIEKSKTETQKSKKEELWSQYIDVTKNLEELRKNHKVNFDEGPLITEYNKIQENANEVRKKARYVNEAYHTEKNKIVFLEEEISNLEHDKRKIQDEINKLTKQELNVELYKEAESFFSNLDIKICPHCEAEINESKKESERKKHICSLCGETSIQQKVEDAELQVKLEHIKEEKDDHKIRLQKLQRNISFQKENLENLKRSSSVLYEKVVTVPSVVSDNVRLKEIEAQIEAISKEREQQNQLIENEKELIKREAVLKFQMEEIDKEKFISNFEEITTLSLKKEVLTYALQSLERKRIQLNKDIITKLEQLVLNEIHAFGLSSIDKIEINGKYELVFTQNGVNEKFSDLTEGEKLRVKLAFYLSLIQMDIEHKLGRHPRFLIFDSPGSEEMVPKHLQGLSDILKKVNIRFKNNLQIFVGSALREFSQITDDEKAFIKGEEEFIF
jgi:hypothetical protein